MQFLRRIDRGDDAEFEQVLAEDGAAPRSPEALHKESTRLRKRFQVLKEKLQAMAREAGLVPRDDDGGDLIA